MSRRGRGLSEEDARLWTRVTESVAPLKRRRRPAKAEAPATPAPAAPPPGVPVAAPAPPVPKSPPPLTPLAPIDRNERRRLSRGTRDIDGRIDLHGMRQEEAHAALRGFLAFAQARGHSIVLVITGKGRAGLEPLPFEAERGVLRRVVPQWLRQPDLRPLVVGFEEAHHGHGGAGALYVRLRRKRAGPAR
jgi:DNA-nicking Smr family endonuclease